MIELAIIFVFSVVGCCAGFFSGLLLLVMHTWFTSRLVDTVIIPSIYGLMFLYIAINILKHRDLVSISFMAGWIVVSIYVVLPILRAISKPAVQFEYEDYSE